MDELRRHKNSDTFKWVLTFLAFVVVAITIAGMLLGYITPKTPVEKEPTQQEQEMDSIIDEQASKLNIVLNEYLISTDFIDVNTADALNSF
jgi:hypothetical protein